MKADEIQNKIEFTMHRATPMTTEVHGKLCVYAKVNIHERECCNDIVLSEARKSIAELIMRHLYEDQRRELYEAIDQLFLASPYDYGQMSVARERILKLARRQPPHPHEQQ